MLASNSAAALAARSFWAIASCHLRVYGGLIRQCNRRLQLVIRIRPLGSCEFVARRGELDGRRLWRPRLLRPLHGRFRDRNRFIGDRTLRICGRCDKLSAIAAPIEFQNIVYPYLRYLFVIRLMIAAASPQLPCRSRQARATKTCVRSHPIPKKVWRSPSLNKVRGCPC